VRIDDRERAAALAAKQVRRARRLVVEQLPKEHVDLLSLASRLDKLSIDQLNNNR
jgi:hypothetical protein